MNRALIALAAVIVRTLSAVYYRFSKQITPVEMLISLLSAAKFESAIALPTCA